LDVKRSVGFSETVRMVPFKLPKEVEINISGLMSDLGLNCGAIDIIKNKNGEFYFLEVNPVGQVLGYSNPVNYKIEKEIANWLINNNYE
jgi:glutathione synthase/RimK-type ligase-like ATP-grasp enzyme